MNMIMIGERGFESALSACPAPVVAFDPAAQAVVRPRAAAAGHRLTAPAVPVFQGTGLPGAVTFAGNQVVKTVPTMLVQLHPGDTARRPPA